MAETKNLSEYSLGPVSDRALARSQGCSVLKDTNIVEKVIKVQAVVKECKADVLDVVLTQNVEGKTPQFGEDMRIGAHTRFVFAQGHITDIVISIFNTPMIADSVTKR